MIWSWWFVAIHRIDLFLYLFYLHQFKIASQFCPSIKNSSSVETSQSSSAANTDAKNSFSISDKALFSWSALLTPAGWLPGRISASELFWKKKERNKPKPEKMMSLASYSPKFSISCIHFVFRLLQVIFYLIFLCQEI